ITSCESTPAACRSHNHGYLEPRWLGFWNEPPRLTEAPFRQAARSSSSPRPAPEHRPPGEPYSAGRAERSDAIQKNASRQSRRFSCVFTSIGKTLQAAIAIFLHEIVESPLV